MRREEKDEDDELAAFVRSFCVVDSKTQKPPIGYFAIAAGDTRRTAGVVVASVPFGEPEETIALMRERVELAREESSARHLYIRAYEGSGQTKTSKVLTLTGDPNAPAEGPSMMVEGVIPGLAQSHGFAIRELLAIIRTKDAIIHAMANEARERELQAAIMLTERDTMRRMDSSAATAAAIASLGPPLIQVMPAVAAVVMKALEGWGSDPRRTADGPEAIARMALEALEACIADVASATEHAPENYAGRIADAGSRCMRLAQREQRAPAPAA